MIGWIKTVEPQGATGELRELYEQVATPHGEILEVNQVCAYFSYSNRLLIWTRSDDPRQPHRLGRGWRMSGPVPWLELRCDEAPRRGAPDAA